MLWQFFFLRGIENGIEYRYFSRYRIEVRNSSIMTTLVNSESLLNHFSIPVEKINGNPDSSVIESKTF